VGNLYPGRTEEPLADPVAAPDLGRDLAVTVPVGGLAQDGFVPCGIEIVPHGLDGLDAAAPQHLDDLPPDEIESVAIPPNGVGAGTVIDRHAEGAIEIVDDRQDVAEHVGSGRFGPVAALLVGALAVVVELGGHAQQPIVQVVAFLLQRGLWRPGGIDRGRTFVTGHGTDATGHRGAG
jgi:hypothetical protein